MVVRLIFELYTVGEKQSDNTFNRLGTGFIAKRLNAMKVPPKQRQSMGSSVYS